MRCLIRSTPLIPRRGLAWLVALALVALALPVPAPALAATTVVGNGTAASCTATALAAAAKAGGTISFNCGSAPVTIAVSATIKIQRVDVTIDGGNKITLQGSTRLFEHATYSGSAAASLTLQNMTLSKTSLAGTPSPGGIGPDDPNGPVVYSYDASSTQNQPPILNLINVQVRDNASVMTKFEDAHGGGAIFMRDGIVNVRKSTFTNNTCTNCTGGAIHVMGGALTVEDSSFTDNISSGQGVYGGGAIFVDAGWEDNFSGDVKITGSVFRNNSSPSGGALHYIAYRATNSLDIDRSSWIGNTAQGGPAGQGGAVFAYNSGKNNGDPVITIRNSLLTENWAKGSNGLGLGGALWLLKSAVRVSNTTIVKNTAHGDNDWNPKGGAMYLDSPTVQAEISNSTIAYNHAGGTGGGISVMNGNATLRNSIVAFNTANNAGQTSKFRQNCNAELSEGGNNLEYPPRGQRSDDATCLKGKSGLDQRNLPEFRDPKLGTLADNGGATHTLAIAPDSPALDAGASCEATDQRGVGRPQGKACDIGAYELVLGLRLNPSFVQVGAGSVELQVTGAGFTATSTVLVDGQERPTRLVSASELRATLGSGDTDAAGELAVSVDGTSLPAATLRVVVKTGQVYLPLLGRR
jgi:predicted outer membrane repeat protein